MTIKNALDSFVNNDIHKISLYDKTILWFTPVKKKTMRTL